MLTPRFKISQDENHVFITVHAPYTNIGDTEIDVDGENFLFVSSPYFLRLRLPGKIVENGASKGSYTCDSGDFHLTFDKETPGEQFGNLDMITSLLAPRDIPNINPDLVQMLEEDGITVDENDNSENNVNESRFTYGFANKISNEFSDIGGEFPQIFELKVPEQVAIDERNKLRINVENEKFCSDHYLADLFDEEIMEPYLSAQPFWDDIDFNKDADFTDDEVAILKEIPVKHYLLSKTEYKKVLFGLVDILFGYCYDKRTTLNESTVESSWTINKLSSTLSWFCNFKDMKQVLVACYRRALIYPMYRNFDLCNKVKKDVISLLRKGKKFVIKCMVEIHQMFNTSSDARYILNQLYIKDYLVFIQKCRVEELDELNKNIANIEIEKKDLDLDLDELEHAAHLVQQEEIDMMENEMDKPKHAANLACEEDIDIMENEVAVKMASMSLLPKIKRNHCPQILESGGSDSSSTDSSASSTTTDDYPSDLDSDDDPF